MSLNSPQDSPLKHAHRSATKIWARLSIRTGFFRPSNLCSSRKQTKSLARVLTSLAAEFLPEAIRFVMLHEYFCGTSDSCVGLRSRRLRAQGCTERGVLGLPHTRPVRPPSDMSVGLPGGESPRLYTTGRRAAGSRAYTLPRLASSEGRESGYLGPGLTLIMGTSVRGKFSGATIECNDPFSFMETAFGSPKGNSTYLHPRRAAARRPSSSSPSTACRGTRRRTSRPRAGATRRRS